MSYPEYALNSTPIKSEPVIKISHRDTSRESIGRLNKQIIKLEEMITKKETELELYRDKRYEPEYYHDHAQMDQLNEKIDMIHNELNAHLKDWELISSKIQELKDEKPNKA